MFIFFCMLQYNLLQQTKPHRFGEVPSYVDSIDAHYPQVTQGVREGLDEPFLQQGRSIARQ